MGKNTEIPMPPEAPRTDRNVGLSDKEVEAFQTTYGFNELAKVKRHPLVVFLSYFWGPMPVMIWIAIIIEGVVKDWPSFGVFWLLQILNGGIGYYEEVKAGNAIGALEKELALVAYVRRNGEWKNVPARELVEGDIIHLKLGDVIPADCELLPGSGLPLVVDQASINGESLPASKDAGDEAYQGTVAKRGECDALVLHTGERTFLGRASSKVAEASVGDAGKHFQKLIFRLTMVLCVISFVAIVIIIIKLAIKHRPVDEIVNTAIVILVACIPIAIEVVCTSTMAVGARELARKNALITRLAAIEEMAAMNILCSDKTGTLTLNQLSVKRPMVLVDSKKNTEKDLLLFAALAAKLEGGVDNLDAIDKVIRVTAEKEGVSLEGYEQQEFVPFDPVSKRTEGLIKQGDSIFRVFKGAPQVILAMSSNYEEIKDFMEAQVNDCAMRGFRTIGVAKTDENGDVVMIGAIPLFDPPRHDTKATVKKANALGIEVKMITGDQLAIAKETCRQLDMGDVIFTPELLETEGKTDEEIAEQITMIEESNGMAEVFPEHKFDVVQLLQKGHNRIGMTGDGVNDAPALKAADVGIAVSDSTDAARAAADIVLLDEGLSVIIDSIRISRTIFARMRNFVVYRIAETVQLLLFFFIAIMAIEPPTFLSEAENSHPDSPKTFMIPVICLVLITIVNDGAMLTMAYDNAIPSGFPSEWDMKELIGLSTMMGCVSALQNLLILIIGLCATHEDSFWLWAFRKHLTYPEVLGMVYIAKSVAGLITVFTCRTGGRSWWARRPAWILFAAVMISNGVTVLFACTWPFNKADAQYYDKITPVSWEVVVFTLVWCFIWFLIQDALKVICCYFIDKHKVRKDPTRKRENIATMKSDFWKMNQSQLHFVSSHTLKSASRSAALGNGTLTKKQSF